MSTSTSTDVATYVHTSVHLAGLMLSGAQELLLAVGIAPHRLVVDPESYENAFRAWLQERSLKAVRIECYRPNGALFGYFEFEVSYSPFDGGARFVDSQPRIRRAAGQFGTAPSGATFEVICSFRFGHTPMPGWGPLNRPLAISAGTRHYGTYGSGPGARVGFRFGYA